MYETTQRIGYVHVLASAEIACTWVDVFVSNTLVILISASYTDDSIFNKTEVETVTKMAVIIQFFILNVYVSLTILVIDFVY